ncbi:MAG: hypothetical protein HN435_18370, partial [Nitrospinaceae bacterium]|nr:hypothetical protein [Nitrospinaceae bacterium]
MPYLTEHGIRPPRLERPLGENHIGFGGLALVVLNRETGILAPSLNAFGRDPMLLWGPLFAGSLRMELRHQDSASRHNHSFHVAQDARRVVRVVQDHRDH